MFYIPCPLFFFHLVCSHTRFPPTHILHSKHSYHTSPNHLLFLITFSSPNDLSKNNYLYPSLYLLPWHQYLMKTLLLHPTFLHLPLVQAVPLSSPTYGHSWTALTFPPLMVPPCSHLLPMVSAETNLLTCCTFFCVQISVISVTRNNSMKITKFS